VEEYGGPGVNKYWSPMVLRWEHNRQYRVAVEAHLAEGSNEGREQDLKVEHTDIVCRTCRSMQSIDSMVPLADAICKNRFHEQKCGSICSGGGPQIVHSQQNYIQVVEPFSSSGLAWTSPAKGSAMNVYNGPGRGEVHSLSF
jgi:hypothetical protein